MSSPAASRNSATPLSSATQRVLAVIPARLRSTRLPEKPLKQIAGKTLIERVYRQASQATRLTRVVVATDAPEIEQEVKRFGGEVVMTDPELSTGSERVRAAMLLLGGESDWDIIVNVQGDMPFIPPAVIDEAIQFLVENRARFEMATIGAPILSEELYLRSSVVKVAVSESGQGLFFSRAPIPFSRDGDRLVGKVGEATAIFGYKHFGLYLFTPKALEAYATKDQSPLEQVEKLEQLRLLERGFRVGVLVVDGERLAQSIEIDTPEDLTHAQEIAK